MMNKNNEVAMLSKKIEPMIRSVEKASLITSEKEMIEASEILSVINKYADTVKEAREKITKPLNTALKEARAMFKPLEDKLSGAIDGLRQGMGSYQTEKMRMADEEASRIASRVKEGKGNLSAETAVERIAEIDKPIDTVVVESGTVKFRPVKRLVIEDASLIPREYLVADETRIKEVLVGGGEVAGCKMVIEQVPVNFR